MGDGVTTSVRDRRLLNAARGQPCQWCGRQDGTTVAAHSNQLRHGKGMGIKASDARIAFLCHACHHEIDQGSRLSKLDRQVIWGVAHRKSLTILREMGLLEADDQGAGQAGAEGAPPIRSGPDVHAEDDAGLRGEGG